MGVTSWELGVLRVPLIMVPDKYKSLLSLLLDEKVYWTHCYRSTRFVRDARRTKLMFKVVEIGFIHRLCPVIKEKIHFESSDL
jgi:hypothetical protein